MKSKNFTFLLVRAYRSDCIVSANNETVLIRNFGLKIPAFESERWDFDAQKCEEERKKLLLSNIRFAYKIIPHLGGFAEVKFLEASLPPIVEALMAMDRLGLDRELADEVMDCLGVCT